MFDIIGPAGPLMYPDQIFRDKPKQLANNHVFYKSYNKLYSLRFSLLEVKVNSSMSMFGSFGALQVGSMFWIS